MPNIHREISQATLVTVYEAVNETLREMYVGLSLRLMGEIERRLRLKKELAHWGEEDRIVVRAIDYSLPYRDARDFVRRYEQARANSGWNVLSSHHLPDLDHPAARPAGAGRPGSLGR